MDSRRPRGTNARGRDIVDRIAVRASARSVDDDDDHEFGDAQMGIYAPLFDAVQENLCDLVTWGGTVPTGDGAWTGCQRTYEPCVVYSFGSDYDFSFEDALLDSPTMSHCDVHTFDPTQEGWPSGQRALGGSFWAVGVGAVNSDAHAVQAVVSAASRSRYSNITRSRVLERGFVPATEPLDPAWPNPSQGSQRGPYRLRTLRSIMRLLGHETVSILKMDIEGSEWTSLLEALTDGSLSKVDQLLVEFHRFAKPPPGLADRMSHVIDLLLTDFIITSAKWNELARGTTQWCCVEVSMVRRR
jgi:hypothetical protein